MKRPKAKPARSKAKSTTTQIEATKQKGGLLTRDLWKNCTDSGNDIRVVNTGTKSHLEKTPEKCLQEAEQAKKKMYLEACLQKRRKFYPFVASIGGIFSVEEAATLKRISSRLAKKWRQTYYRTCGYVKSRISINLVQAKHWCIRGSRVT